MKKIFFLSATLFTCYQLSAQKNFEGKAVYKMTSSDSASNALIDVFFGTHYLKVNVTESKSSDNKPPEDLLLDFDKGLLFTINNKKKTYTKDSLRSSKPQIEGVSLKQKKDTVLIGYTCKEFGGDAGKMGGPPVSDDMKLQLWYADSLFYTLSPDYVDKAMLPLFTNGKSIGLGMTMSIKMGKEVMSFVIRAVSFKPQTLADSIFRLPEGFTEEVFTDYYPTDSVYANEMPVDSAYIPVAPAKDTVVEIKKAKKNAPKKTGTTNKKQPQKAKTPIRKPEN